MFLLLFFDSLFFYVFSIPYTRILPTFFFFFAILKAYCTNIFLPLNKKLSIMFRLIEIEHHFFPVKLQIISSFFWSKNFDWTAKISTSKPTKKRIEVFFNNKKSYDWSQNLRYVINFGNYPKFLSYSIQYTLARKFAGNQEWKQYIKFHH